MKINWAKGFTLIELLIVIAILGIVAGGVVVAINPLGKLNSANLAKVKTFAASTENALIISQVGKWSFEEGSGTTVKDTSGYGNNGTLTGGATWQTSDQCGLGFGGCFNFDQTNYVSVPNSSSLNLTSDMTIVAWIKPSDITSTFHLLGKRVSCGGGDTINYMFVLDKGKLIFYSSTEISSISSLKSNAWAFIVASISSTGQVKLYIDGKLDKEGTVTFGAVNSEYLKIGDAGTGCLPYNRFKGLIDEVAIYSQALLSSQIQQLYAQGLIKHQLAYR